MGILYKKYQNAGKMAKVHSDFKAIKSEAVKKAEQEKEDVKNTARKRGEMDDAARKRYNATLKAKNKNIQLLYIFKLNVSVIHSDAPSQLQLHLSVSLDMADTPNFRMFRDSFDMRHHAWISIFYSRWP